jgi:hypothetical protein
VDVEALLKRSLKGRSLDLVNGTKAPISQSTSDRDGAVLYNCVDVETVEWLKSITTVLTIKEGIQLRCAEGQVAAQMPSSVAAHKGPRNVCQGGVKNFLTGLLLLIGLW